MTEPTESEEGTLIYRMKPNDRANKVVAVIFVLSIVLVIGVFGHLWWEKSQPDYCDSACRVLQWQIDQVNACMKTDQFTRDQCVKLVAGE